MSTCTLTTGTLVQRNVLTVVVRDPSQLTFLLRWLESWIQTFVEFLETKLVVGILVRDCDQFGGAEASEHGVVVVEDLRDTGVLVEDLHEFFGVDQFVVVLVQGEEILQQRSLVRYRLLLQSHPPADESDDGGAESVPVFLHAHYRLLLLGVGFDVGADLSFFFHLLFTGFMCHQRDLHILRLTRMLVQMTFRSVRPHLGSGTSAHGFVGSGTFLDARAHWRLFLHDAFLAHGTEHSVACVSHRPHCNVFVLPQGATGRRYERQRHQDLHHHGEVHALHTHGVFGVWIERVGAHSRGVLL